MSNLYAVAIKGDGFVAPTGKWALEMLLYESAAEADKQVEDVKSKGSDAVVIELAIIKVEKA